MTKKEAQQQAKIDKLGQRFEDEIAEMITSTKPATEEVLIAAVAALAGSLAGIAISCYGEEKAPRIISFAVNEALKRTLRQLEKEKKTQ